MDGGGRKDHETPVQKVSCDKAVDVYILYVSALYGKDLSKCDWFVCSPF